MIRILGGKIGILGKMSEGKQFYTVKDLEELLFLGERAIRDKLERGEIKGFKVGGKGRWLVNSSEVERLTKGQVLKPLKDFDWLLDLVARLKESLPRICAKDWVVWQLSDASWFWFPLPVSTKERPAELSVWPEHGKLEVNLRIEDNERFPLLLMRLKAVSSEFRKWEEWKQLLTFLISKCQEMCREIWHKAEGDSGLKMVSQSNHGKGYLLDVPEFIYKFALDNYGSENLPELELLPYEANRYKLAPAGRAQYVLAVGSEEEMTKCKEVVISLCRRYSQDERIGKINEEEAQVRKQAKRFQKALFEVLTQFVE